MANIKKVMRLNQSMNCTFCQVQVNPYVLERKQAEYKVECPNCEYTWFVYVAPTENKVVARIG